ncbi:hypothetical protein GCM10007094_22100 [Pseudovibrio japonicus]|uniref:Lipoprotein n=1 Tax=Pseudovibrio japonicus TaxID=366534 RepID=A0ABQ3EBR4_9HYPH|nr:hypothetical protein GCM10007094_22100 [Pseudovibrio japonicus]
MVMVLSAFWSGSAFSAQQVDLSLCVAGDGKTPVPRWEVVGASVEAPEGEEAKPFSFSVAYPPPAYHSLMAHLRVQLGDLDEASCTALRDDLVRARESSGQDVPLVVQWLFDDGGAQDDVRSLDFNELPEFTMGGCWLDGVYQFVAQDDVDADAEAYTLTLVPMEAVQEADEFCRPIQEG